MQLSPAKNLFMILTFSLVLACDGEPKEKQKRQTSPEEKSTMRTLFIGSYTKKEGHVNGLADGIYTLYQDRETGNLSKGKTVAEVVNPSFVKVSAKGNYLYAVSELGEGDAASGYVYAFRILENDSLEELSKLSTESFAPAHIETDQTGEYIFVANYMGGVVMIYQKNGNGSLRKKQRVDLENPQESHAHSVTISADNKHAYIADLGNDKIWIYHFDAKEGILNPASPAFTALEEGAGPRHFTIADNEKYAYSINELNSSVSVFKIDENGGLEIIQNISSLPEGFTEENSGADIHLHPSGKFLYVSNRGHNSIASFVVDENSGKLTALEHISTRGKTPRNFAISPDGKYLYAANQDTNSISVFAINGETGKLVVQGEPVEAMTPVCIEFAH